MNPTMEPTRVVPAAARRIVYRTKGHTQGPITRLMSPGDLGELVKPFVFLDYFDFSRFDGGGGPVHPHSGLATHTTLLQGNLEYADSTGKWGELGDGSIEWMRAGGGVWHGGAAVAGKEPLRGFQLWAALPPEIELTPAESHYVERVAVPGDGLVRVLLGSYGDMASPIDYPSPVSYLHVRLLDGERWTYEPRKGHNVAWLAVATGSLLIGGAPLAREMAVFEEGQAPIEVVAWGDVEFVLGSAVKHPHPLVTGMYSVHTSPRTLMIGEAGIEDVVSNMLLVPGEMFTPKTLRDLDRRRLGGGARYPVLGSRQG